MGKAVKLTPEVTKYLEKRKRGKESYDAIFRRLFGLPTWRGVAQEIRTFFVVLSEKPTAHFSLPDARGAAIQDSVRKGAKPTNRKHASIIEVREIPK